MLGKTGIKLCFNSAVSFFLVVWFFQIKCEDMDASVSVFFFCHRDTCTNTRASYDLPQTCLPEKAFSHAKGFCLLPVIKMVICKQRLDTNNSVICELVSICCELDDINKAYDLH